MQNPQNDRQALAGRTYCTACGTKMLRLGQDFTCPTQIGPFQEPCANDPINADRLLRMLVTRIIDTVMTDPVIDRITDLIQQEAAETSSRLQAHLDQTEITIEELNRRRDDLSSHQDPSQEDAYDDRVELNDIDDKATALAYEARNSRREIDSQAFISDQDIIRSNALDVATFLDEELPEHTQEFIRNFVNSVGVGPNSVHLTYRFPIPTEEHPEGTTTEVIPRADCDQTAGIGTGQ